MKTTTVASVPQSNISRYSTRAMASMVAMRDHSPSNPLAIVLGDDRRYWVCSRRDAATLVAAGYEYAA